MVGPRNGWVAVYDEVIDEEPTALVRFARELSSRMGAVVIALSLEVDEVVRMVAIDRGGIVDEYLSMPEFYGPLAPGDVIGLAANPTVLARLTGADPQRVRDGRADGASPADLPPAREILASLAAALGLDGALHGHAVSIGSLDVVLTLYDAPRCPYCARTRIVLAEKGVPFETVTIDLANRPAWLYEHNPPDGRVPVLEDDGWVLSESSVIDEYLDERYPEPALLPSIPRERAVARFLVFRFDDLGGPYYAFRRGEAGAAERLAHALADLDRMLGAMPFLTGRSFGLADASYLPWLIRAARPDGSLARRRIRRSPGGSTAAASGRRSPPSSRRSPRSRHERRHDGGARPPARRAGSRPPRRASARGVHGRHGGSV